MTEQKWLASTDPIAMLDWLYQHHAPSDRKLRLFGLNLYMAFCQPEGFAQYDDDLKWIDTGESKPIKHDWNLRKMEPEEFAYRSSSAYSVNSESERRGGCLSRVVVTSILRDIVGNPFQTVALPLGEPCRACNGRGWVSGPVPYCERCNGIGHGPSPVLTPLVLSLAQAAYTVRTGTGTLDNDALAVLSDALEEAGLDVVQCKRCDYKNPGRYTPDDGWGVSDKCKTCKGTGKLEHPILTHLRESGPHYRGCWATDILLGKK